MENAIYHGLKQKQGKGLLSIKGYKEDNDVMLIAMDDGVGMDEETIAIILHEQEFSIKKVGFGISNVNNRIKLLYGKEYGLCISSTLGKYTAVTLKLPIT